MRQADLVRCFTFGIAGGRKLEQSADRRYLVGVRFDQLALVAPETIGGMPARIAPLGPLGPLGPLAGVAFFDPTSEAAAVAFGILGLIDELVPVALAGGQDLFVGELDRDAYRMENIFEEFKARPSVGRAGLRRPPARRGPVVKFLNTLSQQE